jgi:CubicO group peptidase (beta-lactamase class C family)
LSAQLEGELHEACRRGAAAGTLHGLVVAAGRGPVPDLLWAGGNAAVQPARRAMTGDGIFDIASVTKVMATATACGICIDRGLLDPDAPVRHYLPDCAQPPGPELLVRDLATHTSGFANDKFVGLPGDEVLHLMRTKPGTWPVRERYNYACRNFVLLGLIVERLVGRRLDDFCQDAVFAPLGMSATVGYPVPPALQARVVPGSLHAGPDLHSVVARVGRLLGHAGLFAPAADIARFCAMMLAGGQLDQRRILGERALAWLTRPCSPAGLPPRTFGYDMRPGDPPEAASPGSDDARPRCPSRPQGLSAAAYGHSGWSGQNIWIDPQRQLYLIILTNRTHGLDAMANRGPNQRLRQQVGEILLRHLA